MLYRKGQWLGARSSVSRVGVECLGEQVGPGDELPLPLPLPLSLSLTWVSRSGPATNYPYPCPYP